MVSLTARLRGRELTARIELAGRGWWAMNRVWMIVEDDAVIRSILTAMLSFWDVQPLMFEDGYRAWEWLDEVERGRGGPPLPDVALLDIRLPGPQGWEIGRRMRQIPATSAIPIVMMTAYHLNSDEAVALCEAVQPDYVLNKPLPPPQDFRSLIEGIIANSRPKAATLRLRRWVFRDAFSSNPGTG